MTSIACPDLTVNSAFQISASCSCAADRWLPTETTWAEVWLGACLLLTTHVCVWKKEDREGEGNDRQLGPAVSCHSVPITTSLMSKTPLPLVSPHFCTPQVLLLEASWMSVWQRDCKGEARRESRNEAGVHFPRCSWLLSAPEDLSEHFQNKEIVCVGAQIANPRIYAHLHADRHTLTLGHKKCYSNSF